MTTPGTPGRLAETAGKDICPLGAFHHAALSVRDCEASSRWYQEVLGLQPLFSEDGAARRARVLAFQAGGYAVGFVEHHLADTSPFDPRRTGLDHLAFTVASLDVLRQWEKRLDQAGITHSGIITVPTGAILNFKDPDGIALALFCDNSQ